LALNKIDLFPCLDFDMEITRTSIGNIYPGMPVFELSAKTEDGFDEWIGWLTEQVKTKLKG
jgi:hydrogenase nickel incorporation protein HypB